MATNRRVYSTAAATAPAGTAMASSTALRKKSKSSRTRSESLLTFASAARNSASPAGVINPRNTGESTQYPSLRRPACSSKRAAVIGELTSYTCRRRTGLRGKKSRFRDSPGRENSLAACHAVAASPCCRPAVPIHDSHCTQAWLCFCGLSDSCLLAPSISGSSPSTLPAPWWMPHPLLPRAQPTATPHNPRLSRFGFSRLGPLREYIVDLRLGAGLLQQLDRVGFLDAPGDFARRVVEIAEHARLHRTNQITRRSIFLILADAVDLRSEERRVG